MLPGAAFFGRQDARNRARRGTDLVVAGLKQCGMVAG